MSVFNFYGWKDFSQNKPSFALVLRNASGGDVSDLCLRILQQGDKLVKYRGMWMTATQAKTLKLLNHDTSPIDESPALPTATNKTAAPKPFRIMDFPFDIREKILACNALDFVAAHSPSLRIPVYLPGKYGMPSTAIRLPPVTKAGDRKLCLEAILVIIKLATLEIHSGEGNAKLQKWLASLRLQGSGETDLRTGFDAVHSLYFPYFSRYPFHILPSNAPNNDIELMRRCEHLREVKIMFAYGTLSTYSGHEKSVQQLREDYRLDGMLNLPSLRTLTFIATNHMHAELEPLKAWFEKEYRKRETNATQKLEVIISNSFCQPHAY